MNKNTRRKWAETKRTFQPRKSTKPKVANIKEPRGMSLAEQAKIFYGVR